MLVLSIGGYPVRYTVETDDHSALSYTVSMGGMGGKESLSVVTPSPEAWARFWRSCKRIGVDNWRDDYAPKYFTADGTRWKFDIQTPELKYTGKGDNAYPPGFQAFCSAVSRLLGGLEFY